MASNAKLLRVLEESLGDAFDDEACRSLKLSAYQELANSIKNYYENWEVVRTGEYLGYSGGWIAGNFQSNEAKDYFLSSLLYYPSVLLHDPLENEFGQARFRIPSPPALRGRPTRAGSMKVEGFEPNLLKESYFFSGNWASSREWLATTLSSLRPLRELIENDLLILVPQWELVRKNSQKLLTAMRHDSKEAALKEVLSRDWSLPPPNRDQVRGMNITPSTGWLPIDQDRALIEGPSYFLNKTLIIASEMQANYIPPAEADAALLSIKYTFLKDQLSNSNVELKLIPSIIKSQLPIFENLDPKLIMSIRRDEKAFEDWRAFLRSSARLISSNYEDGDAFEKESADIFVDAFRPVFNEISALKQRSTFFRSHSSEKAVEFTVDTMVLLGVSAAAQKFDEPALLALGLAGPLKWLYTSTFGNKNQSLNGHTAIALKLSR